MNVIGNPMFNSFNSFNSFTPFIGSIPWVHSLHSVDPCNSHLFSFGPAMFSIGSPFAFEWARSIILWGTPLFSKGLNDMGESNEVDESTDVNESNESTELNELNE